MSTTLAKGHEAKSSTSPRRSFSLVNSTGDAIVILTNSDVEKIRVSTEGIVRHGERIRAVELGEDKVELTPVLPHAVAKASGE